ncbi:MAG: O-antigen ligase family protein [bacterium]|nr:O-antigen ligase family protein [bacterium]
MANAYRMIKDHPFFGIGYFRYLELVGEYNQTSYIPLYGLVKRSLSAQVPIHDIYLGWTAEEGLFGIALVLAFYLVIARSWLSLWRSSNGRRLEQGPTGAICGDDGLLSCWGMVIDYRYFDFINVLFYFRRHCLRLLLEGSGIGESRHSKCIRPQSMSRFRWRAGRGNECSAGSLQRLEVIRIWIYTGLNASLGLPIVRGNSRRGEFGT